MSGQELGRAWTHGSRNQRLVVTAQIRELLDRYPELIVDKTAKELIGRESQRVTLDYQARRKAGLENDQHSEAPGLSVLVTPSGKNSILEQCDECGYPVPFDQIAAEASGWLFIFPRGIYVTGNGSIRFFQEAKSDMTVCEKSFNLNPEQIIRIVGRLGELWQNPEYDWQTDEKIVS